MSSAFITLGLHSYASGTTSDVLAGVVTHGCPEKRRLTDVDTEAASRPGDQSMERCREGISHVTCPAQGRYGLLGYCSDRSR